MIRSSINCPSESASVRDFTQRWAALRSPAPEMATMAHQPRQDEPPLEDAHAARQAA